MKLAWFCIPAYGHTNPTIEVVREKWTVPTIVNGVVPLAAGQELDWKIR